MSILAMSGRVSGGVKGRVAEEQEAARAFGSGTYGKHPAYCHIFVECYHSGVVFAVNVGVSPGFTVFCRKNERM